MSTQAIERVHPVEIQAWKSPQQIQARIQAIQRLMKEALKVDVDYGKIPGSQKPCLLKPGSEQILSMFQIAVNPAVEDLSTDDCFRYRVTCHLTNAVTGEFLGAGLGEASTDETKYKWRRTFVKKEFDNTPSDRRRIKYSQRRDDHGAWADVEEMQIRQEPADLANTVLKMAKKRAQIDATLTVTGASSMFEQDLDEMPDDVRQEVTRGRGKKQARKQETSDVMCSECRAFNGHLPSCKFHPQNSKQEAKTEQKPAEQPKKEQAPEGGIAKIPFQIKDVEKKNAKNGNVFAKLIVVSDDHKEPYPVFCFHATLVDALVKAKGKFGFAALVKKQQGENVYLNMESLIELDGVRYVNNEPIASPSADQLGFPKQEEDDFD